MPQTTIIRKNEDDRKKLYNEKQNHLEQCRKRERPGVIIESIFLFREHVAEKIKHANSTVGILEKKEIGS